MPLLRFSKDDPSHTIEINQDDPFLKITKAIITNRSDDGEIPSGISAQLFNHTPEGSGTENISLNESTDEQNVFPINQVLVESNDFQHQKVKLEIDENEINGATLELHYEIKNLDVSIESPWREFKKHLEEGGNNRILFSAPYGQGKTTFLKEFFKKENEDKKLYEVFHLFPVNYAISANEDIFRYIKTEILFQLLGRDVEFDKERFTYLQTLPKFVFKNADRILAPFLKAIPKIGESAFGVYENLRELTQEYFSEHDRLQIDDKDAAEKFIQKAYEEEGSIYEDNFYSQLIRQLLEQLGEKRIKTVLIIDDTDRMDPDHIFRILNVFAAHFDSPNYENGDSNKFGFDKIIVVCDYDNLHKIFCHKYGASTDFAGYIDKFYSKQIFRYNNVDAIINYVEKILPGQYRNEENFKFLLSELTKTNSISLREILNQNKVKDVSDIDSLLSVPRMTAEIKNTFMIGFFPAITFLSIIFSKEILIEKLIKCQSSIMKTDLVNENIYNYRSKRLIAEIILAENMPGISDKKTYQFSTNGNTFGANIMLTDLNQNYHSDYYEYYSINQIWENKEQEEDKEQEKVFNGKEFYDLVILAVERFFELNIQLKRNSLR
ncbi:P-loop NTPase fold protein [Prolixibacter denitrificans]|nr:P-loop NTPase fold protein [Prolixibacter denitrificans]PSK83700.1 KAP-like P-loop domain-containing protein [Prolixibacter denitrificans]